MILSQRTTYRHPDPVYPLDGLSVTEKHAYSLRKLHSAYAGACIRVERTSDSTQQDIGFVAVDGSLDVPALLAFVGASSGYVRTWYAQVGTDNLTCADNSWLIVDAGKLVRSLDGYPVMRHTGATKLQKTGGLTPTIQTDSLDMFFQFASRGVSGSADGVIHYSAATGGNPYIRVDLSSPVEYKFRVDDGTSNFNTGDIFQQAGDMRLRSLTISTGISFGVSTFSTTTVTSTMHALSDGDLVLFTTTGTLPSYVLDEAFNGSTDIAQEAFYVVEADANTFKISKDYSGLPLTINTAGESGTHTYRGNLIALHSARRPIEKPVAATTLVQSVAMTSLSLGVSSTDIEMREVITFAKLTGAQRREVYDSLNAAWKSGPAGPLPARIAGLTFQMQSRGQRALYDALSAWSSTNAFDISPSTLTIDTSLYTNAEAADLWLRLNNEVGDIQANQSLMAESGWYVLDDGAGKGILGSGVKTHHHVRQSGHDYLFGSEGITLWQSDFRLPASGQGNWMYQNANFARRILQLAMAYALQRNRAFEVSSGARFVPQRGKNILGLCYAVYYLKQYLSKNQLLQLATFFEGYLETQGAIPLQPDDTQNMEAELIPALALIYMAFPAHNRLRRECVELARWVMFGGRKETIHTGTNPALFPAGYYAEGGWMERGYDGRSLYSVMDARAITANQPDWLFLDDAIKAMCKLRAHLRMPTGTGSRVPTGWSSRTGGADQQNNASRNVVAAALYEEGRPLLGTLGDRASLNAAINSAVSTLNNTNAEKNDDNIYPLGRGWKGPVHTNTPIQQQPSTSWPSDVAYLPTAAKPNWYADLRALIGDPSLTYPHLRTATHNLNFGGEVWSFKDTDGTQQFGWVMECLKKSLHPTSQFDSAPWGGGGRIEGLWSEDLGVWIWSCHGKGGKDPDEDTRKMGFAERLPNPGWICTQSFEILATNGSGAYEIAGDRTNLFQGTGTVRATSADFMLLQGTHSQTGASTYSGGSGRTTVNLSTTTLSVGWFLHWNWGIAYGGNGESTFVGDPTTSVNFTAPGLVSGRSAEDSNVEVHTSGVTTTATATAISDGLQIATTLTADGTAQTKYTPKIDYAIPILLRDLDLETSSAIISWHDTSGTPGWRTLAIGQYVTTQHLRIKRTGGTKNGSGYIYFDTPQTVTIGLSWDQVSDFNARTQNILVDMHAARGTPTLWPATTSLTWSARTTAPNADGDLLSMQIDYPSAINTKVPGGYPIGVQWQRFGGTSPAWTIQTASDAAFTTPTDHSGEIQTSDSIVYDFVGDIDAVWDNNKPYLRVKGVDGGTVYSNTVLLTVDATPTLVHHDDFTDSNGTLYTAHTPTPTNYGGGVIGNGGTSSTLTIEGGNLFAASGGATGEIQFTGTGERREWVIEVKMRMTGAVGGNSEGIWPNLRDRPSASGRYLAPCFNTTMFKWTVNNISHTLTAGSTDSFAASAGTWYTIRAWINKDFAVAHLLDAAGTTLHAGILLTNVQNDSVFDDFGLFYKSASGKEPEAEYWKVWRHN